MEQEFFSIVKDELRNLDAYKISKEDIKNIDLCIIDMNNGFAKKGALYSDRVEVKIKEISKLASLWLENNGKVLAYNDFHIEDAKEFCSYPVHCLKGTKESFLIEELENLKSKGLIEIRKNSTNGILAYNPASGREREDIKNYVVVGCVTDICVYQFAVTLRAYLNETDQEGEVFVIKDLVDTFDAPFHPAEIYNMMFFKSMIDNGIKVKKGIVLSEAFDK